MELPFSFKLLNEKNHNRIYEAKLVYEEHEPSPIFIDVDLHQYAEGNFLVNYFFKNGKLPLHETIEVTKTDSWRKVELTNSKLIRFTGGRKARIGISSVMITYEYDEDITKEDCHSFYLTKAGEKVCGNISRIFDHKGKWEGLPRMKFYSFKNYRYAFTYRFSHEAERGSDTTRITNHPVLLLKSKETSLTNIANMADLLASAAAFHRHDNIAIYRYELRRRKELTVLIIERDNSYEKMNLRYNCDWGQIEDFIGRIKIKNEFVANREFWRRCFHSFISTRNFSDENKFLMLYNLIEIFSDYYEKQGKIKKKVGKDYKIRNSQQKKINELCHKLINDISSLIEASDRESFLKNNSNIKFKTELIKRKGFLNIKIERLVKLLKIDLQKLSIADLKIFTDTRNRLIHGPSSADYQKAQELNISLQKLVNLIIIRTLNKEFNLFH